MQVLVENIGKLERKLTVSLPADGLQNQISTRPPPAWVARCGSKDSAQAKCLRA
jgi:hypothetical protein